MQSKNTSDWVVKKCKAKKNHQLKSLVQLRPRNFNHLLLQKMHKNLLGVFPTMNGVVTLGHLLYIGDDTKR